MKNTFKKRAGRAALAGATLIGLTAAGLALAAPASAADASGMVSGPIANATKYLNTSGTSYTTYNGAVATLQQGVANGTIPKWTYPKLGQTGLVTGPDGRCLVGAASGSATSMAVCNDTVVKQNWTGKSATSYPFGLVNSLGTNFYLHLSSVAPAVQIYGAAGDNSNLTNGLSASAAVIIAPSLTSPLPGASITPGTVFSGAAQQATVVTVLDKDGTTIGTATAGADNAWSLTLDPAPMNGAQSLKVVATDTNGVSITLAEGAYTMTQSDEERALTSPGGCDDHPGDGVLRYRSHR